MKSLLTILLLSAAALAQTATGVKSNGPLYASDYDFQPVKVTQGTSAAGLGTIYLSSGTITLPNGRVVIPYATNVPLTVGKGAEQETVTPSAVTGCYINSPLGSCAITATFSQAHSAGTTVTSGDQGKQEALNDAALLHSGIVIDQSGNVISATDFANVNKLIYSATANGMKCDDATDDTASFNALLAKVNTAGGGTIYISGMCLLNSAEITFPNDGQASPKQSNIRLTSAGAPANGQWGAMPTAAAGLDLRFNATDAKLVTLGVGKLEIDHLFLKDGGSDCAPFLLTTNTTLLFHDNTVQGTASAPSACNDVLILGGTGLTSSNTVTGMFQGYGTFIQGNWFDKVKRGALYQNAANNIVNRGNTFSVTCGFSTGGAFEVNSNAPSLTDVGNVFSSNLFEVSNYKYGINFVQNAELSTLIGNSCYDPTATNTSCVNFGATNDNFNTVIEGYSVDTPQTYLTDAGSGSLLFTSHSGQPNVMNGLWKFTNSATPIQVAPGGGVANAYDILNTTTSDEVFQKFVNGGVMQWQLNWKPSGGAVEAPVVLSRDSATLDDMTLGKSGDTGFILSSVSGADFKLRAIGASNVVWFCPANSCNTYVDTANTIRAFHLGQNGTHDAAGTCTAAAATTCTVTFGTAYSAAPVCTATDATNIIAVKVTPSTTGLVITTAASSSDTFDYHCIGNPN